MSKFNVGDKIIPAKPEGNVHYDLTENKIYVVAGLTEEDYLIRVVDDTGEEYTWNIDWFELAEEQVLENAFDKAVEQLGATVVAKSLIEKETQMTAEQIREEIIRIDARIEEAKKDIENANVERNSLVDNLREKGFEMVKKTTQLSDRPFLEIGENYVINDKNSSTWMETGVKVTCIDIDPSSRKLDAKVEDHLGNDDWVNSECLTKI